MVHLPLQGRSSRPAALGDSLRIISRCFFSVNRFFQVFIHFFRPHFRGLDLINFFAKYVYFLRLRKNLKHVFPRAVLLFARGARVQILHSDLHKKTGSFVPAFPCSGEGGI